MKTYILQRIITLRNEITNIDQTSNYANLKLTKFEKRRVFELRCKINILNEVLEYAKI